jgi:hypothetical protein
MEPTIPQHPSRLIKIGGQSGEPEPEPAAPSKK